MPGGVGRKIIGSGPIRLPSRFVTGGLRTGDGFQGIARHMGRGGHTVRRPACEGTVERVNSRHDIAGKQASATPRWNSRNTLRSL